MNHNIFNGKIESVNSHIKIILKNDNGYRNFSRMRNRIMYSLNKHVTPTTHEINEVIKKVAYFLAIIKRKLIRQILLNIGFRHFKRVEISHLNLVFSTLSFFFKTPTYLKVFLGIPPINLKYLFFFFFLFPLGFEVSFHY